jgi:hypothetical protein
LRRRALLWQNAEFDSSCEGTNREIVRFSRTFICKSTGERLTPSLQFERAGGSSMGEAEISIDCDNPTPYQTDPPSTVVMHQAAGFRLELTPAQAPESCGSIYWDPLLAPHDFGATNSTSSSTPGGGGGSDTLTIGLGVGIPVGVLLLAAVYSRFGPSRGKRYKDKKHPPV